MKLLLCLLVVPLLACHPLTFKDGKFKIVQFTDLHYGEDEFTPWGPIQDKNSDHVMHVVLASEDPDFVLFTGDVLTGNNIDANATEYWKYVLSPCVQRSTPWAHVFGNHDDLSKEKGDRETLMSYDMTYNLSYSQRGEASLPGVSNYFIPIYREGRVGALIYVLDSGGGSIAMQVSEAQVQWLTERYHWNTQMYGNVPSILSFHVPTSEFQHLYNQGNCLGDLNNTIDEIPNFHLYETILSLPNIIMVTTGHYHENDFCCPIKNKLICQGRHSGYGGYSNVARGGRVMVFENNKFETWIRMEMGEKIHHMVLDYDELLSQEV